MEYGKKGLINLVSQRVKFIFEDGRTSNNTPHYSSKEGTVIFVTDDLIVLEVFGGKEQGIQISKILRYEVV